MIRPLHWLICPRYATLRAAVPGWQDHTNHDTKALMMHLLPSRSPWATDWKHALTNVPDHTKHFLSAPCPGHQHVFVDGTATKTGTPYDIASWGCINATTGLTIATGHVSGLVQSSARAELMAALSALTWQVHFGTDMTLWMDAKYVHDGIDFIQQHGVAADWSDQDLWNQLEDQLEQLAPFQLYLRWIPSHLDVSLLENPYEDWVHLWNGRVDLLVGHYNLNRPADFQHLWQCAQQYHREVSHRLKQLSVFFGKVALTPKPTVEPAMGEVQIVSADQLVLQDLFGSDVVDDLHSYETPPGKVFTISFLVSMLQWLTQCGDELEDGLVVYPICFEEIAICLAHQPQFCFPFWNAHTGSMDNAPLCTRFQKPTLSWILSVVRAAFAFLRFRFGQFGDVFFTNHNKVSLGIHRPCNGLYVRMSQFHVQRSSDLTTGFTQNRPIRKACDLARPVH